MLIDDEFASIGSANFQSRSMYGVDEELQAAVVADDDLVQSLRMDIWAVHLRQAPGPRPATLENALRDLDTALAIWRTEWGPAGMPQDLWRRSNSPPGFTPTATVLEFVGPQ